MLWPQPQSTAWRASPRVPLRGAAGEAAVGLHVADGGLDGAAPSEIVLERRGHAAALGDRARAAPAGVSGAHGGDHPLDAGKLLRQAPRPRRLTPRSWPCPRSPLRNFHHLRDSTLLRRSLGDCSGGGARLHASTVSKASRLTRRPERHLPRWSRDRRSRHPVHGTGFRAIMSADRSPIREAQRFQAPRRTVSEPAIRWATSAHSEAGIGILIRSSGQSTLARECLRPRRDRDVAGPKRYPTIGGCEDRWHGVSNTPRSGNSLRERTMSRLSDLVPAGTRLVEKMLSETNRYILVVE